MEPITSPEGRARLRDQIRVQLGDLAKALNWRPTQWARAAGLAPSTLNRFLNQEVQHIPSTPTLHSLVDAARQRIHEAQLEWRVARARGEVPPEREHSEPYAGADELLWSLNATLGRSEAELKANLMRNAAAVTVIGTVEAGVWREAIEWDEDKKYNIHVPMGESPNGVRRFALEVSGNSMNLVYPQGTILICEDIIDRRQPENGERVIVIRRDRSGLYETTVKEYQVDAKNRIWLIPQSSDPEFQTPMLLEDHHQGEEDSLRILAAVIGSYRPEKPRG